MPSSAKRIQICEASTHEQTHITLAAHFEIPLRHIRHMPSHIYIYILIVVNAV